MRKHAGTVLTPRRELVAGAAITAALLIAVSVASFGGPPAPSSTPAPSSGSLWDQIGWERAPRDPATGHDLGLGQWMAGVVAGGPGFVAWGLDTKRLPEGIRASMTIWVSADAWRWREVILDPGRTLVDRIEIRRVAAGPEGVVASGGRCCGKADQGSEFLPTRWFSPDGEHWTRAVAEGLQPDPGGPDRIVVAGPGGFVEGGKTNDLPGVWFSPNGTSWTGTSLAVEGFASGIVTDLATDAHGYLAVGSVWNSDGGIGVVWRSLNGSDWVRVGVDDAVLSTGPVSIERVVSYPRGWFAIGHRAIPPEEQTCPPAPPGLFVDTCRTTERVHLTSPDGDHWTELQISDTPRHGLGSGDLITGYDSGLMAMGPADESTFLTGFSLWTLTDGEHWTRATEDPGLASGDIVHGFVVAGDRVVAVGDSYLAASGGMVWIATPIRETIGPSVSERP